MLLSLAGLAVGLVVSLPLGLSASRRPRLAEAALGVAGVVQTVPSLALLVLMVPLLGGVIGFLPAFVALTLYSILPILANTIVGIRGVDPTLIEAARGLGMSDRQMLFRVQLPLAAPVIISGIRTATVLVVGTATLVTPVGGVSLGNYIFGGLETLDYVATVFGCVFAAVLAIVLDQLIRLLEVAARRRNRPLALAGTAGLLLVLAGGLYGPVGQALRPAGADRRQRPIHRAAHPVGGAEGETGVGRLPGGPAAGDVGRSPVSGLATWQDRLLCQLFRQHLGRPHEAQGLGQPSGDLRAKAADTFGRSTA